MLKKREYRLYEIIDPRGATYKYGITRAGAVSNRSQHFVGVCSSDKRNPPGKCSSIDRGTRPTMRQARLWEEASIADYARRHGGRCPLWHQNKRTCK